MTKIFYFLFLILLFLINFIIFNNFFKLSYFYFKNRIVEQIVILNEVIILNKINNALF